MTNWARCGKIGEVRVWIAQKEMVNYLEERMKKCEWIRFGDGDMAGEVRIIFVCRTGYRWWFLDMKVQCRTNKWHHDNLSVVLNDILWPMVTNTLQLHHPWSRFTCFPPLFTVRDERYKWRRIVRTDDDDNCTLSNLVI